MILKYYFFSLYACYPYRYHFYYAKDVIVVVVTALFEVLRKFVLTNKTRQNKIEIQLYRVYLIWFICILHL